MSQPEQSPSDRALTKEELDRALEYHLWRIALEREGMDKAPARTDDDDD